MNTRFRNGQRYVRSKPDTVSDPRADALPDRCAGALTSGTCTRTSYQTTSGTHRNAPTEYAVLGSTA